MDSKLFHTSKEVKPTLETVFIKQENSPYENCLIDKLSEVENLPEEFTKNIADVIDKLATWQEGTKKPTFVWESYRYGAFFSKNIGSYQIWRVKTDSQQGGGGGRGYNKPALLYHLTGLYECDIDEASEVISSVRLEKGEYLNLKEVVVVGDRIKYILKRERAFIAGSDPVPAATAGKTGGGQS